MSAYFSSVTVENELEELSRAGLPKWVVRHLDVRSINGKAPKNHCSDIEGRLGWWQDTRFATEALKFIMGGVALGFSEWANEPDAGQSRDWKNPNGKYAVAPSDQDWIRPLFRRRGGDTLTGASLTYSKGNNTLTGKSHTCSAQIWITFS